MSDRCFPCELGMCDEAEVGSVGVCCVLLGGCGVVAGETMLCHLNLITEWFLSQGALKEQHSKSLLFSGSDMMVCTGNKIKQNVMIGRYAQHSQHGQVTAVSP